MNAGEIPAAALVAAIRQLRNTERKWPAMAASPEHRGKLEEAHALLSKEVEVMARVIAEGTRTRDALAKVLRKVSPRILA